MKYKYKCPNCGSTKLSWWYEDVVEIRYKCKTDGKPSKKPYKKIKSASIDDCSGLVCEECGELVNSLNNDFYRWENK